MELAAWRTPKFLPGPGLLSHDCVPQAPSLYPCCLKTGGSIMAAATCVTLGIKGRATHPSVPKEEPSQSSSPGCSVTSMCDTRHSNGRGSGTQPRVDGQVWSWEEGEMILGSVVLGRDSFPCGKWPNSSLCVPSVSGHGRAHRRTGDPSPPCLQIPVCLSIAAQRRHPPTAHRHHHPPPHHPLPG